MLVEFRVKNYKSFKDEQIFSMVASSDASLPSNTINTPALGKLSLVNSAVIYGANASGKSNLISALGFVKAFVTQATIGKPDADISVQPFWLDSSCVNYPSEFEMTFIHENVRYQYGFAVDNKRVHKEWLVAYPKKSPQTWFERTLKIGSDEFEWYFGPKLSGEKERLEVLTRVNALFLSVATTFNHKQLSNVYKWFSDYLRVVDTNVNSNSFERYTISRAAKEENFRTKVKTLLQKADLGITDFIAEEKTLIEDKILSEELLEESRSPLKSKFIDIQLVHQAEKGNNSNIPFSMKNESYGTRRLFAISGPLLDVLEKGNVLFVDELDASLHPTLLRSIISVFHDPEINQKGAQLIFNTHDSTLLDLTLFRRDQIWFVEKDNNGASHLYPLSDFSPRKDEALQKGYLQGRYGAVPFIEGPLLGSALYD